MWPGNSSPSEIRGRGECRMPSGTRSLACRKRPSRTRVFTARHRKTPGIPARNGFNSLYALSPAIACCHRRLRIRVLSSPVGPTSLRRLDASCGRQDHTISPSASASFVLRSILKLTGDLNVHPARPCHGHARRCRVHRISSRVSDDRDTPLIWNETAVTIGRLEHKGNRNIFRYGAGQPKSHQI